MRCRKIDKLLESADYVGNKWCQLCADTAGYGPSEWGEGGPTEAQCAAQASL